MSTAEAPVYRWTTEEFVRAWELGAFGDHRVELVEGEVWSVTPIGTWHGETTMTVGRLLWDRSVRVLAASLPSGPRSLPDPDCWVLRRSAEPVRAVGQRLQEWAPADVLLVVEVSDTSTSADLTTKTRVYGSAGYPVYWVVTPDAVSVFTEPHDTGYGRRTDYRRGDGIPVPYADAEIAVADLVGE